MRKFNKKAIAKKFLDFKWAVKACVVSAAVILCGLLYSCGQDAQEKLVYLDDKGIQPAGAEERESAANHATKESAAQPVYAYVCGCVQSPGVYETCEGARIYTLIEMAGGFTDEAAGWLVSMAETVCDGQTLYVPSKEQAESGAVLVPGNQQTQTSSKVNINSATKEQLMTLAGIGESRAEDIISYRSKNGGFKTIEDIMNVSGIKEAAYEKIKENICVR
ncbi:MAG: helix-hairpin-helix domain-containing protein [Bacteroides sp.]